MQDSNSNEDRRTSARKRAQNHFQASEQRDVLVRQIIDKERAATDAKIAKLRALRLAKEAADREAAALSGEDPEREPAPAKPRARKKRITIG